MKTLIVGFGNDIRGDDGLPFYVIDEIEKYYSDSNSIEFLKTNEAGFNLIDIFYGYDRIIIIDTVNERDLKKGHIIYWPYKSNNKLQRFVLSHNTGILTILELYNRLKINLPEKIEFILINIKNRNLFETKLSINYKIIAKKILKIIKGGKIYGNSSIRHKRIKMSTASIETGS